MTSVTRDMADNQLRDHSSQVSSPPTLTTSNGAPVDTLTASLTVGGRVVLQDFTLLDHLSHFDRERIPERVVHAKGAGAKGYFVTTQPRFIQSICKAQIFRETDSPVPVTVRFSTVGGESGSADTARDPRGFAVKFFTTEGVWDLVGNNTPIFFIRDPILFPSFIHTQKRNPATHIKDPDMFWDFMGLRPETVHQMTFLFTDRGTPDGYRHMNGYGSHTFKNVNHNGEAVYVKYHLKTDQGIRNLDAATAERLAMQDPDYAIRDLYNAISKGQYPSWTLYVQVMTYEQAQSCKFDPFDLTKIWPHGEYPLHEVGRLYLNENPKDYFTEVEQLAFSPSHMVPGIEPSPDKMLQARLFSYPDTHRHRLGANYQSLPCNNASIQCPVFHYQRDGPMQFSKNGAGAPNYFPNSFQGPQIMRSAQWHKDVVGSSRVERVETSNNDNFTQCGNFFRNVLTADERERLTDNVAGHLCSAQPFIRRRVIQNLSAVDPNYGRMVSNKVDAILNDKSRSSMPLLIKKAASPLSPPRNVPKARGPERSLRPSCPYGYSSKL